MTDEPRDRHPRRVPLPVLDHRRADPEADVPREKCGVFGVWGDPEPAHLTYLGLFALQHRGQESAGIAATNGAGIERATGMGLVSQVFTPERLAELDAFAGSGLAGGGAIGHNRYSTTGASRPENAQPFRGAYSGGAVAIAHNGNLVNAKALRDRLGEEGRAFASSTDTEVVLSLLASHAAHHDRKALEHTLAELRGAFSIALLFEDRIEAARDPWGWRPLVLGRRPNGALLVASETVALDVAGATFEREVEPGEIVTLSDSGVSSRRFAKPAAPLAQCVFEHVYFASPASRVFGASVEAVRERLGATLAREAPVDADMVSPMPDSGRSAATGYAAATALPYREAIIPNRYVGRTFIKPTGAERAAAVRLKLNVIADVVQGKRLIIVDDSIVRGTTTRAKMDQIRAAGAKEIHLRISCPPIKHPCYFGVDFPDRAELVAHTRSVEEIRELLGVDSLAYLSLDGLLDVVSARNGGKRENYCTACYSGEYPIRVDDAVSRGALAETTPQRA